MMETKHVGFGPRGDDAYSVYQNGNIVPSKSGWLVMSYREAMTTVTEEMIKNGRV